MRRFWPLFLSALILTGCAVLMAQYKPDQLAPPFATKSANNGPRVVARPAGAELKVPQGFHVEEYAGGFERPRFMLLLPNHAVLLSDSDDEDGAVWVLKGTQKAESKQKIITGLRRPYGLALWQNLLYVAEPGGVKRYEFDSDALKVKGEAEQLISWPGFGPGHWTRSLLFDRDGSNLYIGIGSESNVNTGEDPRRAAINRYNPDGTGHRLYASGTRNPIGLHWYPGTDVMWAAVQERDGLGDELVPDYFTHVEKGAFYGWPYAYSGPREDPRHKGERPDLVQRTIPGDILLEPAHVAVLDFTFYTGKMFPEHYQGGAFLAFHGSWNRSKRTGYEVCFIPFKDGKPSGGQEDFLTGFMESPESRDVWGRPVAVLQMPDGSLLVSDDGGDKIWRISYSR